MNAGVLHKRRSDRWETVLCGGADFEEIALHSVLMGQGSGGRGAHAHGGGRGGALALHRGEESIDKVRWRTHHSMT